MMPFKKNLPAAGSGFSDYYVPEEKFLGPPSPKNLATPLLPIYLDLSEASWIVCLVGVKIQITEIINNNSCL